MPHPVPRHTSPNHDTSTTKLHCSNHRFFIHARSTTNPHPVVPIRA
nr:hypothetical protein L204_06513 [Cryptococcus depauperatus CBS 7855]